MGDSPPDLIRQTGPFAQIAGVSRARAPLAIGTSALGQVMENRVLASRLLA
jgi:hypothetical protein